MHASFLGCSRNKVVQNEGTQKGDNHGRAKDGQGNRGTIAVTKWILVLVGKVATRSGHGETVEEGKADDELVAWTVQINVLQVG